MSTRTFGLLKNFLSKKFPLSKSLPLCAQMKIYHIHPSSSSSSVHHETEISHYPSSSYTLFYSPSPEELHFVEYMYHQVGYYPERKINFLSVIKNVTLKNGHKHPRVIHSYGWVAI